MRFPFAARRGNGIPFQSNIPGRTFRNQPHPETETRNSTKNRATFSRALDATLDKGDRFICAKECPQLSAEKERPQVPPQ